jgi:iron complex outermembrane receptor protein
LQFTAGYFRFEYQDRVQDPSVLSAGAFLLQEAAYSRFITRNPTASQLNAVLLDPTVSVLDFYGLPFTTDDFTALIDGRYQNVSTSFIDGIDASGSYSAPLEGGTLAVGANFTYMRNNEAQPTASAPALELLNNVYNPIGLRGNLTAGWSRSLWSLNARINYARAYHDAVDVGCAAPAPVCRVASWTTLDLTAAVEWANGPGILAGTSFGLDLLNVFDTDPPHVNAAVGQEGELGYDPLNATPLGRFVALKVTRKW